MIMISAGNIYIREVLRNLSTSRVEEDVNCEDFISFITIEISGAALSKKLNQ